MKKVLAIILSLVFVLTMATVSFAGSSTITAEDYDWTVGFITSWPVDPAMTQMGRAKECFTMMKDKVAAGTVSVVLADQATYTTNRQYETGFYFMADVTPVKEGEAVTGATVNDAYLVTLNSQTHDVVLYRVTAGAKESLASANINTLFELADPAAIGNVTLEAVFTADGEVTVNATCQDQNKKVLDYTEDASAPAGDDVVLYSLFAEWTTANAGDADNAQIADYSATAENPEMGDTTAIVAVVAIVALLGCGVAFTASKKRI